MQKVLEQTKLILIINTIGQIVNQLYESDRCFSNLESQVERVTQEMAMADPTFKRRNTEITDFISMQQKQIVQMMNRQASGEAEVSLSG